MKWPRRLSSGVSFAPPPPPLNSPEVLSRAEEAEEADVLAHDVAGGAGQKSGKKTFRANFLA